MDTFFNQRPLEVQGSLGGSSENFITRLCRMLCRSHDDQRAGSFLKQRISKALQIGNAACVLGTVSDRDAFEEIYYIYSRTRIKETFGYKKRFHSSDFMQVKLSTLIGVSGNRSKERDRKSELVLRSTYQIFEWDRNNSDRNFYNVVRYVHIPLVRAR